MKLEHLLQSSTRETEVRVAKLLALYTRKKTIEQKQNLSGSLHNLSDQTNVEVATHMALDMCGTADMWL